MPDSRSHLQLLDDPVAETLALLNQLPFPVMAVVLLVALRRAVNERALPPASRLFLLHVVHRLVAESSGHRAA
jgi:hypothetical protein